MAILTGNVIGDPAGTVGHVVYGKARTRDGKVVTMRRWARPTNPRTAGQTSQRSQFADAVQTVRALGPSFYQVDWNRIDGQLPGFHSLMHLFLENINAAFIYQTPADVPMGTLHVPATQTIAQGPTIGLLDYTWSAEVGQNGDAADDVICFAVRAARDPADDHLAFIMDPELTRATSPGQIDTGESNEGYICGTYLRSTLGEPANLSICNWTFVNTGV